MDLYCPQCGEPWDVAEFQELTASPADPWYRASIRNGLETRGRGSDLQQFYTSEFALQLFRVHGCRTFRARCNETVDEQAVRTVTAALAMGGNDVDAVAAACEDLF